MLNNFSLSYPVGKDYKLLCEKNGYNFGEGPKGKLYISESTVKI